jgi:hypothetical protein
LQFSNAADLFAFTSLPAQQLHIAAGLAANFMDHRSSDAIGKCIASCSLEEALQAVTCRFLAAAYNLNSYLNAYKRKSLMENMHTVAKSTA